MAEDEMALRMLTEEESKDILAQFEEFKAENGIVLNAVPFFSEDGRVMVNAKFLKVVNKEEFEIEDNGNNSKESAEG